MSRSFNTNNKKMSLNLNELRIPAGVVIGKKGCMINHMKKSSGAYIKIQENLVIISGHITAMKKAREMVMKLAVQFNIGNKRTKKKVIVEDGWTTKGQMNDVVTKVNDEKINKSYMGVFAALDEEVKTIKIVDSWPSLVSQPEKAEIVWGPQKIPDTVVKYANCLPTHRSFREMNSDLVDAKIELAIAEESKNWADKADIDDIELKIDELYKEIAAAREIQNKIPDHPDM
jgi:rRNA processing protein Krr1/Pno1